ncbi:monovalent cation/H+ antiporter complex subunit F [Oerskovia flava]|uniref:monovalent cation/H+ antiporter complex subunit F n=1 Tax=Oerskovia flava TaxID=2986422 RepID=UPI00224011E9|nr:monovalent cation/H+ antiporter complex subunit F [Oerskovia sp. JB1-3-2]
MIALTVAAGLVVLAMLAAAYRMIAGPDDANRAVAADLFFFAIIAIIAIVGVATESVGTFDLVLVASLVGFLSALSLARALTRGER